jgi:hypothetical protein
MEQNETRLIALVNLFADAFYPNPDDPEPIGPWGPWIREALNEGQYPHPWRRVPLPDPWSTRAAATTTDGHWWQEHHPGPPPYWKVFLAEVAALAGQVDDHDRPFGGRRPRPNWVIAALLHDLASLDLQHLPSSPIGFARSLANVALRHAREAGGEEGSLLLRRFSEDWCGTVIRFPSLPIPLDLDEPRPPRPEESLVLGAALIRATGSSEIGTLKQAGEDAGRRIFQHGLSGLA